MHSIRFGSISLVAAVALVAPRVSLAQETKLEQQTEPKAPEKVRGRARLFSLAGHLAISSDAGLEIANTSISGQDGSTTSIQLRPAVDYFVIDNLSVGGFLGLDYVNQAGDSGHTTTFSIGPRFGYNIPFAEILSVWPKIGLSYAHTSIGQQTVEIVNGVPVATDTSASANHLALNLFVPVMIHPVEHFFLGFGPAFDLDLTGDNKATTIAGRLTIGGWL
jgi:hypothetical protein